MNGKTLQKLVLILIFSLLTFSKSLYADTGVFSSSAYDAKPFHRDDWNIYFQVRYRLPKMNVGIYQYELNNLNETELFRLGPNESVIEMVSSKKKLTVLAYDARTKDVKIYKKLENGLVKKEKLFTVASYPYFGKAKDKIYLSYEEKAKGEDNIKTLLISVDIDGKIKNLRTAELKKEGKLYSGDYIAQIGHAKEGISLAIIEMDKGDFDGKNLRTLVYRLDSSKEVLEETKASFPFLITSVFADDKYVIANKYETEDPYEKTLNIYYLKEDKYGVFKSKEGLSSIKSIYKNKDNYLALDYDGMYKLDPESASIVKKKFLEPFSIFRASDGLYILKTDPRTAKFEIGEF